MSDANDDVTRWITELAKGDEYAAQKLWTAYFVKLSGFARQKLVALPGRVADEEDVALSAMKSFWRGMASGRFPELRDRDDLWKLLVTITARKANAQLRYEYADKRGRGLVRGESAFENEDIGTDSGHGIGQVADTEPAPDFAVMMSENLECLLDQLDNDTLRRVVMYKLEGHNADEIAEKIGCVRETVQRKLKLIRKIWTE